MSLRLDVPVLHGSSVRLEPLAMRHASDLARAAEEDRSSYGFTLVPRATEIEDYLAAQCARGGRTGDAARFGHVLRDRCRVAGRQVGAARSPHRHERAMSPADHGPIITSP